MKLLTKDIRRRLLANGQRREDTRPVLKLFNPCGAATWIITEMDEDGDTLYGLADLGQGSPELGYVSLAELEAIRLPFGLSIEREIHFKAKHRLSAYAQAARTHGRIVEDQRALDQGAAAVEIDA